MATRKKDPIDTSASRNSTADAKNYWAKDVHHDGRPTGRTDKPQRKTYDAAPTPHIAAPSDEEADRRYQEEEMTKTHGRRRTVFDAADEMDNPGLSDTRDVMQSGRRTPMPPGGEVAAERHRVRTRE